MHVEKNVSSSILGYILGDRDTVAVRKDMELAGVNPTLHMQRVGGRNVYLKPHAPYSLKPSELPKFLSTLSNIKTPTGYMSSSLSGNVGEKKLQGLKSHDHHVILQQILPASIRGFLHPGARDVVIRMGHCFERICTKVVNPAEMQDLQKYVAETVCLFEIWFPPSFFDIMVHLIRHLVEELAWFGPVHSRWSYGVERYLYVLKSYVRTRSKPEASIAKGYMYTEALGYVSEHLSLYPQFPRVWDMEEDPKNSGEVLQGAMTWRDLSEEERRDIHEFVISNVNDTAALYRYGLQILFFIFTTVLINIL